MNTFADIPLRKVGQKNASLLSLLEDRDVRTFRKRCAENKGHLDEHDDKYTYLQYACQYNLPEAVEALLANGANPNLTCHSDQCSPIMMAGRQGYFNIVEMLSQHDNVTYECTTRGTVLHSILDGLTIAHEATEQQPSFDPKKYMRRSFDMRKHIQCLEMLLQKVSPNLLDINAQNEDGHTALHLAVKLHEKRIIRLLLDHGAYIGSRCNRGNMAICLINSTLFKEYLDDCIVTNDKLPIDPDFEIIYKYHFLVPPRVCNHEARKKGMYFEPETGGGGGSHRAHAPVSETEPLIELSRVPELRHLLKHPVLTSFLNMKWFTIRKYFWVNFTFYLTFWLCLTVHTLFVYSPFDEDVISNRFAVEAAVVERRNAPIAICTWYPSVVLCGLLGLREFFQFTVSPLRYLTDVENLLDVALLTSNLLILFCKVGPEFAAVAVLLTWIELVVLINRHPSLSPNIEMYKVVCTSFLKLLAWCSMLIVAFALSFYLLFKDTTNPICTKKTDSTDSNNDDNSNNNNNNDGAKFFEDVRLSFFKVILMMTGEFETSAIPFDCHPGVSHVVFVLFVFLVAIVLFNMMNGLAVSDTQAIRSDAEIVGNVSRAKLIAYIETMATANPFNCLNVFDGVTCTCRCCDRSKPTFGKRRRRKPSTWRRPIRVIYERANLFPYVLPDSCAHVFPNCDNVVDLPNNVANKERRTKEHVSNSCWTGGCLKYTDWYISNEIMRATKELLVERIEREEKESCSNSMERYSAKLEEYGKRLSQLEEITKRKLNEVIELLQKRR